MRKHQNKINVKFQGIADYIDGENAPAGTCQQMTNLREKRDSVVAVGQCVQIGTISDNEKIVAVHHTSSAKKNVISTIGNAVMLHSTIAADGSATTIGSTLTSTQHAITAVHGLGDFLMITTEGGNMLLKYDATTDNYIKLDTADAIPRLLLSASGKHTLSETIPAYTFAKPLQQWQGPLQATDADGIAAIATDTYHKLCQRATAEGYITQPVLARYAVRLWNDDYLWVSAPVLLGHGIQTMDTTATATTAGSSYTGINAAETSIDTFRLSIVAEAGTAAQWDGLVKSIDILVSGEIDPVATSSPIEWTFSRPTVDNATINRLSFNLQAIDSGTFISRLLVAAQWRVACSIYDLAALRQGNVNASNCQVSPNSTGLPAGMLRYEITGTTTSTVTATAIDRCASASARRYCHTALYVHNRRMFAAGGNAILVNPWHPSQLWHGSLTAGTCRIVTETHIKTNSGEAVTVWQGTASTYPETLNPIISYPDARATSMTISILPTGGTVLRIVASLHSVPELDMACSSPSDGLQPLTFTDTEIDTLPIPAATQCSQATTGEVVEYEELNPLAIAQWHNVCDSNIRAIAATSHHTNNNIGTPLYIFADDGTYALPYRVASARYSPAVILSRHTIAPTVSPADCDTAVYFVTTRGEVCRLERYSAMSILNGMESISQMAWNSMENELWLKTGIGIVVVMASGRTYLRNDAAYDQLFHLSPIAAFAATDEGSLLDISREQATSSVAIKLLTFPIAITDDMPSPQSVTWKIFSDDATLDMRILGEIGASCHRMTLCSIKASGSIAAPIKAKLIAPPVRTVRLSITGTVAPATIIRPALIVV